MTPVSCNRAGEAAGCRNGRPVFPAFCRCATQIVSNLCHPMNPFYRNLLRGVVTLLEPTTSVGRELLEGEKRFFRNNDRAVPITSLDALAPTSPLIPVMAEAPNSQSVSYHNIFAVEPRKFADGASSRMETASWPSPTLGETTSIHKSPSKRLTQPPPLAILELRRILLEHLGSIDNPNSIQLLKHENSGQVRWQRVSDSETNTF